MLKKYRSKWLEALRSGNYRQTYGQLKESPGNGKRCSYCVMGLLCNIFDNKNWKKGSFNDTEYIYNNDSFICSPPSKLLEEVKLPMKVSNKLISMNDDDGKSFSQLADWIEKNVPAE